MEKELKIQIQDLIDGWRKGSGYSDLQISLRLKSQPLIVFNWFKHWHMNEFKVKTEIIMKDFIYVMKLKLGLEKEEIVIDQTPPTTFITTEQEEELKTELETPIIEEKKTIKDILMSKFSKKEEIKESIPIVDEIEENIKKVESNDSILPG